MLAAAVALAAALAPGSLAEGPVLGLEREPLAIAVGRFDRDARADVLVRSGRETRLLSGGARGFARPRLVLPGVHWRDAVVADFDGDGRDEIAAVAPNAVVVASLETVATHPVVNPYSVSVGDAQGDGRPEVYARASPAADRQELRVIDPRTGAVSIRPLPPVPYGTTTVVGDLDGDRRSDLVLQQSDRPEVRVLLGDDFADAGATAACKASSAPLIADVDADGDGDVVVPCRQRAFRVCLSEAGRLTCRPAVAGEIADAGLRTGDFDGDGRLDLLAATDSEQWDDDDTQKSFWTGGSVAVYRGDGRGGFTRFGRVPADVPWGLAAGDLDGNGRDDAALLTYEPRGVATVLSGPSRWPRPAPRSRARLLDPAPRIRPARPSVRLRIACSRGRGKCRGTVRLRRTSFVEAGRRYDGHGGFSIEPGKRVVLELPLTSAAGARGVPLVLRDLVHEARQRVRLRAPTRAARRASCLRGRVMARNRTVTVLMRAYELYLCRFREGRRVSLGYDAQGPATLAGPFLAFGTGSCIDEWSECFKEVNVVRLAAPKGSRTTWARPDPDPRCIHYGDVCADAVRKIVLNPRGAAAWITCRPDQEILNSDETVHPCHPGRSRMRVAVVRFDSRGVTVLDRGRGLRDLRLSRGGRSVTWRHGSRTRTATLAGRASNR